jgi:hypothetical protein
LLDEVYADNGSGGSPKPKNLFSRLRRRSG